MWFFLSIAAVVLPAVGLCLKTQSKRRLWPFSLGSFLFYALVCMDQLFTIRRRCLGGDYGGIVLFSRRRHTRPPVADTQHAGTYIPACFFFGVCILSN